MADWVEGQPPQSVEGDGLVQGWETHEPQAKDAPPLVCSQPNSFDRWTRLVGCGDVRGKARSDSPR